MLNYKRSIIVGVIGMVIGYSAFLFNYYMTPISLPGYIIFTAPAMLMLSFFSEETYFMPKMILFLAGQFIGYYFLATMMQIINKKRLP